MGVLSRLRNNDNDDNKNESSGSVISKLKKQGLIDTSDTQREVNLRQLQESQPSLSIRTSKPDILDEVFNKTVARPDSTPFLPQYESQIKEDIKKREQQPTTDYYYPDAVNELGAFGNSALNSATLGVKPLIESKYFPRQYDMSQIAIKDNPVSATLGELLGYTLPGGALSKVVNPVLKPVIGKLGNSALSSILGSAITSGTEGALMGGIQGTAEGIQQGYSPSEVAQNALKSGAEFGAFGAILGGGFSGLGKGISNINKALNSGIEDTFTSNIFKPSIESFDAFNLKSPIETTGANMPFKYQNIPKVESPLLLPEGRTPPMVPEQFRIEQAGLPREQIKLPGDTSMLTSLKSDLTESNVRPLNREGNINSPLQQNNALESLMNENTIKPKYSSEIQSKLDAIDSEIKAYRDHQNGLVQRGIKFRDEADKAIKGNSLKLSAEKRKIIQGDSLIPVEGGFTSTELSNKIKYLKTNYKGKEVITPDGEGIATGQSSFGKVGIKVGDKVNYYAKEQIQPKINIDEVIAQQKQSKINPITSEKFQSNIKSSAFQNEPVKIQNTANKTINKLNSIQNETDRIKFINNSGFKKHNLATNTLIDGDRIYDPITNKSGILTTKTSSNGMKLMNIKFDDGTSTIYSNMNWVLKESELLSSKLTQNNINIYQPITEPKETKTSQFRTNTIERAMDISEQSKKAMPKDLFDYEVESSKDWQNKALNNIKRDPNKVIDDIKNANSISGGVQAHEAAIISKELEAEAVKTGNVTKLLDWVKTVVSKTRETARALKATDTAWEKEPTPSKALLQAERVVKNAEEQFAEKQPKKYAEFKSDIKAVKDAVKATAEKVSNELNYSLVNGLKIIDINLQLFAKGKDKMAEYIKKYYTSDPLARMNVIKNLSKEFGLTGEQAKNFEKYLKKAFDKHFDKTAEQYLNRLMNAKGKQNVTLEKVLKLIKSGAYDEESIASVIKEKYGMPSLTQEDAKFILNKMRALQRMKPDSDAYRITLGKVQKLIADKQPATFREKFRGLQRIAYLTNPKTLVTRNPLGNVILSIAENTKDIPGAVIDVIISTVRGSERTTLGNPIVMAQKLGWQAQGIKKGFRDWLLDIKHGVDTSATRGQLELPSGRTFDNKILNGIDQFVRQSLQVGDRPFYEAAYHSRLNELLKIKNLDVPTNEMKIESRFYALDRVFQNDSVLANKAKQLRNSLGFVGDMVMPFTQTPANVLDKLIDYTGGGLIKGLVQIGKSSIKGEEFNQKLFVDRLARTFTGVGLISLGYTLMSKGIISGGPDKNKDVNTFNKQIGNTPYSINLGEHTLTFDWAQPISGLFAMGADAYKAGKSKADLLGKITAGGEAGINTMLQQSFLQGVMNLMSGYSPAVSIGNALTNSTTGLASPTGIKQIAKVIDPIERETYSPSTSTQYINNIIKNIPFLSRTLPEKKDVFGNTIQKESNSSVGGVVKNIFNTMFNPGNLSEYKPNEVQKEIMRVYDKTGKTGIYPNVADKQIKVNGENYPLDTEQYIKYQSLMGKYVENTMQQVMKANSYKNPKITDEQRAQALSKITEDSKQYAEDILAKDMGLKEKKVKRKSNPIKVPDNSKKKY